MKIIFSADLQVKVRDANLFRSTEKTLKQIENVIKETKAEIYVVVGDFFEYDTPNDNERKLINGHLGRILSLPNIKELVLMCGNHDLMKEKKMEDYQLGLNPIDIFADLVTKLDKKFADKITYCKLSEPYTSKASDNIQWLPYSLEDSKIWRNPETRESLYSNVIDTSKIQISLYHDILKEFIDETKLPIQKNRYNQLLGIDDFKTSLTIAGDIHKDWGIEKNGKRFTYTNSPMQHTHSEGNYFTITNKEIKEVLVSDKNVKLYDTDTQELSNILLNGVICYNTIIIDNDFNISDGIDTLSGIIPLSLLSYGEEQTYIKIKSSSKFLSYEINISETINKYITENKHKRVIVNFTYDKFQDISSAKTNQVISDIQSEVINNINATSDTIINDITEVTDFDSLILDIPKLHKLFDTVLSDKLSAMSLAFDSDVTLEMIKSDIIDLFSVELQECLTNTTRYNIVFNNINCNCFMGLGQNSIDLDNPGVTRISGSNGTGKTTLFNMIRWVWTGKLFESLKNNTSVQNNLLVFNDKLINIDDIVVNISSTINNQHITVKRTANRIWKQNITDEQKLEKNWKQYISKCTSEVTMVIHNDDGTTKEFSGDQVGKIINQFFGDSINTILFLNYSKITSILNYDSDDLKQLILSYIGVNYLSKLEAKLPEIKDNLNVVRPKESKESIKTNINNTTDFITKQTKLLDEWNVELVGKQEELETKENELSLLNDKHITFGNIEEQITDINTKISDKQTKIDSFEKQEEKKHIEFELIIPQQPDNTEIQNQIDFNKKCISDYNEKLSKNEIIINDCYQKLLDTNNELLSKLNLQYENDILSNKENETLILNDFQKIFETETVNIKDLISNNQQQSETLKSQYREQIVVLDTKITDIFGKLITTCKAIIKALEEKKTSENNIFITNQQQINTLYVEIDDYIKELSSGICKTCKRKLDNFDEAHKELLESKILENKNKISEINSLMIANEQQIKKIDNVVIDYQKLYESFSSNIIDESYTILNDNCIELVNDLIVLIGNKQKLETTYETESKSINNTINALNTVLNNVYQNVVISDNSIIDLTRYNAAIETLNNGKSEIEKTQQTYDKFYTLSKQKIQEYRERILLKNYLCTDEDCPNDLVFYLNEKEKIGESITEKQSLFDDYTNKLKKTNDDYNQDLLEYQRLLIENKDVNTEIDTYNSNVVKHNNLISGYLLEMDMYKEMLSSLENKLPEYNEVLENKKVCSESIDYKKRQILEINKQINAYTLNIQNYELQLKNYQKLYDDYILYIKNKLIYDVYKKLIEDDFKNIIFEYYRIYMNNTLNILLEDLSFKLIWSPEGELFMVDLSFGSCTYRPVKQASGMETIFLGLSLIYSIHLLNIKNNLANIFIDELSGQLNNGENLSYTAKNFQELFVILINKFKDKSIFIVDHNITDLFETCRYDVIPTESGSHFKINI